MSSVPTSFVSVDSLVPYARNSRTHSPAQVDMIAASIVEFGFTNAVLADPKGIVAGHGRVLGAQKIYAAGGVIKLPGGETIPVGTVPVTDCSGWTDTQRKAYVIADNQIALAAGWADDLLKLELADLKLEGFDLDLLGFGDQLTDLLNPDLLTPDKDPDDVPDVPEVAFSKLGDVWVCGPHKIICGDSTDSDTWSALMGTELADCVLTDPPFGVSYQAKGKKAIANDDLTGENLREFLRKVYAHLFARLKPGSSVYTFHADTEGLAFRNAIADVGFKLSQNLIWAKDSLVLGRSRYQYRHEPCLLHDKPGGKQRWWGGRKQTTVMEWGDSSLIEQQPDGRFAIKVGDEVLVVSGDAQIERVPGSIIRHPKPKRSAHHPTTKPVTMLERLLKNSARSNDLVMEPFSGSGSTLMACERLGMCARASELDPGYVDVAVMRWQGYTGRRAVHALTGAEFPVSPADCSSMEARDAA